MASRPPMAGTTPYMHSYQLPPGRYHQPVMQPPPAHLSPHAGRHGMPVAPTHGMRMQQGGGVQSQGRVSDLTKKRLAADTKVRTVQKVKKRKLGDKVLTQRVRELVPESQAYMDLLAFEQKLDSTIMRKRLEIQETLKKPMKLKRKLRVFISHQFFPGDPEMPPTTGTATADSEPPVPHWELKVEGRLLDEAGTKPDPTSKNRFTSFFKNLVVELDKDAYGPDNHLAEWHRDQKTEDNDGFTISRPGEESVKATVLLLLNHQPVQYKLTTKLARLLGIHTATRPTIINAVWQYIKTNHLQDPQEREYINNDKYFQQIFEVPRMKFTELPRRLQPLLSPPDPIVIHHIINADAPEGKRTACYDIEVEIDDPLKSSMHSFLISGTNQQEIATLDNKIYETVEQINNIKLQREFYLGFAHDPQKFINEWLASQSRDLRAMKDKMGNSEAERRSSFYDQTWCHEAVPRYFYAKVSQRRTELEQALGIHHP